MKRLSILFLSITCIAQVAFGQQTKEPVKAGLSPSTRHYLEEIKKTRDAQPEGFIYKTIQGGSYASAIIKIADAAVADQSLKAIGAFIGTKAGNIWTVQVPLDKIKVFTEVAGVSYIQLDEPVFPNMDQARRFTRVDSVHRAINLPTTYSGKNVVVGVIDFGFDYNHPTFYDTLGTTFRVKKVWELNGTGTPPAGYAYGRELADTTTIKSATTDNDEQTHGTSVAGMSSGSGYGSTNNRLWRGMAYDADMVFVGVRRNLIESQWRAGGFSDFLDGVKYIFDYATSVGKPAVINISWGSQSGSHDGTSLFNQGCDNLSGAGKIIVMSAGNEGGERIHLNKTFTATDTMLNTFLHFTPNNYQRTWVDIWGDPGKTFCGKATVYRNNAAVNTTGFVCLDNMTHTMYLLGSNGLDTCYVEFINSLAEQNGRSRMTINVWNKTTDTINIAVKGTNGTINVWDEYYYYGYTNGFQSQFSSAGQSWAVNGDTISTVSDMGSANSVLLVGAHVTRTSFTDINGTTRYYAASFGRMAPFSSIGPLIDGRVKPDIAAPGLTIATACSSYDTAYTETGSRSGNVRISYTHPVTGRKYYYSEFSGTSASSPAAAGIVALMLQAKPDLTPQQAKAIIIETAIKDVYTGTIPAQGLNNWGHGKINAYGAVKKLAQATGVYNYTGTKKLDCVLFPNPGEGDFMLDLNADKNESVTIEVFNVTGQKVANENWIVKSGHNQHSLDLKGMAKGNYIVRIAAAGGALSIKTVIK